MKSSGSAQPTPPEQVAHLERLEALAEVLERSTSWFPPGAPETTPPAEPVAPAPPDPSSTSSARPSASRPGQPPLGKKERRELERKQRILAAQRAADARRERRRNREHRRRERLDLKRPTRPGAQPSIAPSKPARAVAGLAPPAARSRWRPAWFSFVPVLLALGVLWWAARAENPLSLERAVPLLLILLAATWALRKL